MISKSDVDINAFIPFFAEERVPVAFLVPTETGYNKAIMDATYPVRELLKEKGINDYESQGQGPDNKLIVDARFVYSNHLEETKASLYRPITKKGDPRIWFSGLKDYCVPCNLLALFIIDKTIFVVNLSDEKIRNSLLEDNGYAHTIIRHAFNSQSKIVNELLCKLKDIHDEGFVKGIGYGDHNVGDTLESLLKIATNSSVLPDYKGIELKTTRSSFGKAKHKSANHKNTLFSHVPDWNNSRLHNSLEILNEWGYWGYKKGERRFNLSCTVSGKKPNSQGLYLKVDEEKNALINYGKKDNIDLEVVRWDLDVLKEHFSTKHKDTFWIKAESVIKGGSEYFQYNLVKYTSKPNIFLMNKLFDNGIITLDYTIHLKDNGGPRDHGYLFRTEERYFNLIFPEQQIFDLETLDKSKYPH